MVVYIPFYNISILDNTRGSIRTLFLKKDLPDIIIYDHSFARKLRRAGETIIINPSRPGGNEGRR